MRNLGALVSEQHRRERSGDVLAEIDHMDTPQWGGPTQNVQGSIRWSAPIRSRGAAAMTLTICFFALCATGLEQRPHVLRGEPG